MSLPAFIKVNDSINWVDYVSLVLRRKEMERKRTYVKVLETVQKQLKAKAESALPTTENLLTITV